MSGYDMTIHQSTDAAKWAKFFIETKNKTNFEIDESLMIGWFANAMMAMKDHAYKEKDQEITRLKKALSIAKDGLGKLELYVSYNGDTWVQEKAREAQKQIKEIMEPK